MGEPVLMYTVTNIMHVHVPVHDCAHCHYVLFSAGVETLQHELQSMQEGFDQQEMELKGLRDHKLAEVQRAK